MVVEGLQGARKEVLDKAERDRKRWEVDPDHWHYGVYKWWLRSKNPDKLPQLNFCHYWRVVIFLALGRLIRQKVRQVWKQVPFGNIIVGILGVAACLMVLVFLVWMSFAHPIWWLYGLGIFYIILSGVLSWYFWLRARKKPLGAYEDIDHLPVALRYTYFVACGLPAAIGDLIILLLYRLLLCVIYLIKDVKIHHRVGHAIAVVMVTTVKVLNAHFKRLPWLRPWWALPVASWMVFVAGEVLMWSVDWRLLFTALVSTTIACVFVAGFTLLALWRIYQREEYEGRLALLSTPGFVEWLWSDEKAEEFRNATTYDLQRERTIENHARLLKRKFILEWLFKYLKANPLPPQEINKLPKIVGRKFRVKVAQNRWRRTTIVFTPIWRFLAGTWALLALLWAGMVYLKRVGACPMLHVKEPEAAPTDTDEPVTA
jgi:hypothetical protein